MTAKIIVLQAVFEDYFKTRLFRSAIQRAHRIRLKSIAKQSFMFNMSPPQQPPLCLGTDNHANSFVINMVYFLYGEVFP